MEAPLRAIGSTDRRVVSVFSELQPPLLRFMKAFGNRIGRRICAFSAKTSDLTFKTI